ncbi:MAG: hypothetical protein KKD21_11745 [Proteobacteria bacterium]|nr:hypothetical protein [Pseudomonadota bacterium]MBU1697695.1 hypothetical protein [Pseudomonadota bacterium]
MLTYKDFLETSKLQTTVFTPNFTFSTSEMLKKLLNMEQNIFDGDPFILPLPADAPKEIPRITLDSKDKKYKLEIAPIRINFFRNKIDENDEIIPNDVITPAVTILTQLLDSLRTPCDRIAIVIARNSIKHDAAKVIASHFCKDNFIEEPFNRPSEFEIHSLKKYSFLEKFEVNSWVRIRSAHMQDKSGIIHPIINIQQDINTIAEATKIYSKDDIILFYEKIYDEFDKILKLYMPKQ